MCQLGVDCHAEHAIGYDNTYRKGYSLVHNARPYEAPLHKRAWSYRDL